METYIKVRETHTYRSTTNTKSLSTGHKSDALPFSNIMNLKENNSMNKFNSASYSALFQGSYVNCWKLFSSFSILPIEMLKSKNKINKQLCNKEKGAMKTLKRQPTIHHFHITSLMCNHSPLHTLSRPLIEHRCSSIISMGIFSH